jgi:hypothetical protein
MCRNGRLAVPCKIPLSNHQTPRPQFFPTMGRGAHPGRRGGGGTPHLLRHIGRGVTPTLNERRGGGWGVPLPPLTAKRLIFCMAKSYISRGTTTGITNLVWSSFLVRDVVSGRRGGGGTPHLLRHMGGGVTPSGKINGGGIGGSPPLPPLCR